MKAKELSGKDVGRIVRLTFEDNTGVSGRMDKIKHERGNWVSVNLTLGYEKWGSIGTMAGHAKLVLQHGTEIEVWDAQT